jgi:hypothetical protein
MFIALIVLHKLPMLHGPSTSIVVVVVIEVVVVVHTHFEISPSGHVCCQQFTTSSQHMFLSASQLHCRAEQLIDFGSGFVM